MSHIIKVEVSQDYLAANGGVPAVGQQFITDQGEQGYVTMSVPETGDPNILVEVPDSVSPLDMASSAHIVDAREQNTDYSVLWKNVEIIDAGYNAEGIWIPKDVNVQYAPGDTFDLCGATDAVREAAKWGAGVFACCVDTGVDNTHEVFDGKDLIMWNPSNGFGSAPDQHGHGTFCLSEIGGKVGMASDAAIGMFQGLPNAGGSGSEQTVSQAIKAAADYIRSQGFPFAVVSMSLGGTHSSVIQAATNYLLQLPNVVVCCAAGNSGPNADIGSPADTTGVIVVGSCNRQLKLSDFSSGGATDPRISCYHVGESVIGAQRGGGYMSSDGTSMATPEVAGEAVLHGAKGRTASQAKALLTPNRQRQLSPPTANGRGFQQLLQEDFVEADAPPVDPPIDPPPPEEGGQNPPLGRFQDVADRLVEAISQCDAVRFDPNATNQAIQAAMGIAVEYMHQSLALVTDLAAELEPPAPEPGTGGGDDPPVPTPIPPTPGAFTVHYGAGAREYYNLFIPPNAIDRPMMVLWHGGGWLQGDPNTAIPLSAEDLQARLEFVRPLLHKYGISEEDPQKAAYQAYQLHAFQVTNWFRQQGWVVAEPAYNYGVQPALADAYATVAHIVENARKYGATPDKLFLCGHSAGGHLSLMCAANPNLPLPKGVIGLAAACIYITGGANDGIPAMTQQILNQAWGTNRAAWPQFSPHTHLNDRSGAKPQNIVVIQGSADDELNPNWAVLFTNDAKRAGWGCDVNMQPGGSHFSVADPSSNAQTAQIIKRVVGE